MIGKSTKKILVVEDDMPTLEAIGLKLKEQGFLVENAFDGEEAMEKIKENNYDLVLLDILLPKKNGFEIIREMKTNDNLKNIKILVFSNLNHSESVTWALSQGIEGYVVKADTDVNSLIEEIKKVLLKK
ncbi:hypothetical protein A2999_00645 [Candidatus Wolfebacteria bacterium RIFCSPLOWO2_01_FULL_38_11]|uniref:Response regulator receiver protein n=2 Tax=Candidatus Wolfeibacteriota TaxID=1752735 RepID=A0A0G0J1J4_9BACT|nr:MAG: Response regulator receiver protein [Candidatus Wolfebacteria bacterium GW2011_GWC1_37_10]OGM90730.1 MAG: hypothetical protein A2999_00645 [Candidatus Wolfebacteria bacterium RIFCSPLOWO2_01_FULL_38_11]